MNIKQSYALILLKIAFFSISAFSAYADNSVKVGTGQNWTNSGSITADVGSAMVVQSDKAGMGTITFFGARTVANERLTNANLTNNGSIELNCKDFLEAFSDKRNHVFFGFGLNTGNNSTATNNGTIDISFSGYDKESTVSLYGYGIQVGAASTMTNNGTISLTGTGSWGTQVRGMTTPNKNLTIKNAGTLTIDVERALMVRGLATAGTGNVSIINSGTMFLRSDASVVGIDQRISGDREALNSGWITAISAGEFSKYKLGDLTMRVAGACALNGIPYGDGYLTNTGVIIASVEGDNASPYAIASGIVLDQSVEGSDFGNSVIPRGTIFLKNTGIIETKSSVTACEANDYLVRASEIGINYYNPNGLYDDDGESNIRTIHTKIFDYATTLRDFTETKNLIQAYKADIDLSSANLIFRPAAGYVLGTSYKVSAATLVTGVRPGQINLNESKTEFVDFTLDSSGSQTGYDYQLNVSGIDSMRISSALPEFLAIQKTTSGSGDSTSYDVALVLNNSSGAAKKLLNATTMLPIDFVRQNMDCIDRELEPNDRIARKFFFEPSVSAATLLFRDGGTDSKVYGLLLGFDWSFGDFMTFGVHGNWAQALAEDSDYESDSDLNSFSAGLHVTVFPKENLWIRAQGSFFNLDNVSYSMEESTENVLVGERSKDLRGIYASLFGGMAFELPVNNELRPEAGLSYMHFLTSPSLEWSYMDYHFEGYDMEIDAYKALYGTAKLAFIHDFAENKDGGSLYASAGGRVRIYAPELTLKMLNDEFDDGVREDIAQGLCELSYRHRINHLFLDVGYRGVFGKDSRNHHLHLTGKWAF